MKNDEWEKLYSMHQLIRDTSLASFDSEFLEEYTRLLAESLRGKGDSPTLPRPNNAVV